ncbi:MAG: hypothetical protein E5X94_00745 [Mesorhizobium sp.]|uniref:carph-isopro domain-containing protein n=1 Tax=unclassified Mesorhizobium TaxID=325217 RepID=UPI000FCCAB0C|nr:MULTISPECIES: hypothetical protein [unclassified Mesorhizobium]RUW04028.1 hypothetical protein EOA49_00420 [Mesorhizobium sp. M1A.F.Ca.IN.020.04.1.1]RUW04091.1 hypothetical protein EOA49_00755 [Mesorhizobium sp. M1A.F.Ca.IN.020.04.1.1]TIN82774.1 MAG: hypothetical protein E5X97_29160 [Mesorhizobium sp.]TIN88365.1 MAG: hypothetical protein E5X94_00745 [Mesorhizobium sp.]
MTDAANARKLLSPAAYVIGKLGGLTKAANKLGRPVTTVQGWQIRGRIPQDHWAPAIAVAESEGVELKLTDFLNDHSVPTEGEAA